MAKSATVKYTCECGKSIRLAPEKIGAGLKCPRCKASIDEEGGSQRKSTSRGAEAGGGGRRRSSSRAGAPKKRREQEAAVAEETPEPESAEQEPQEPAPSARKTSRTRGSNRTDTTDRSPRRSHRTVEGYDTLSKVASFSSLLGILLILACEAIATYFVIKGPAAVMATSAKQAHMFAVMWAVLGIVAWLFLYVLGQFARVLLGLVDVIGDLRSRLANHLTEED